MAKWDEVSEVCFTIPGVPPSVNHYKKPITLPNGVGSYALTGEALAFVELTMIYRQGQSLLPPEWAIWEDPKRRKWADGVRYLLEVLVVLGPKQRGDGDNFWKCIADSLCKTGVIHSDARVRWWSLEVEDEDRQHPRTEIRAVALRRKSDPRNPTRPKAKDKKASE